MVLRHLILVLPIHRRTYEQYYKKHQRYVNNQKAIIDKSFGKPFDNLSQEMKLGYENRWFWPPWIFNDVIGYLKIGSDGGGCLVGEIFLKRKLFPLSMKNYHIRYHSILKKQEYLYYLEIYKRHIELGNNESYVSMAKEIITEAEKIIRKRFRNARVWRPDYDISCIDLSEADNQMRKGVRTTA